MAAAVETEDREIDRLKQENNRMRRALASLASEKPVLVGGIISPQSEVRMRFASIALHGGAA